MKIRAVIVAIIFGIFPLGAEAQNNAADPMVSYTAYNAAIEAGNLEEAANQAMIAWRAAETTWGASNPNTGGLAYNAAWSAMLMNRPEAAIEPARRAVAMGEIPNVGYTLDEANFLLAYAEFQTATPEQKERLVSSLVEKIEKVVANWGDELVVNALINSSSILVAAAKPREAIVTMDSALVQIARLGITSRDIRTNAYYVRGTANIFDQNLIAAVSDFVEARIAYGPPRETEDKTWGQLLAWHNAAIATALSHESYGSMGGSRIVGGIIQYNQLRQLTEEQSRATGYFRYCDGVKFTRDQSVGRAIRFPSTAQHRGLVGGVVAKLSISNNGRVERVILLGAVPDDTFFQEARDAMLTWRFDSDATPTTQCLQNYIYHVRFSYEH